MEPFWLVQKPNWSPVYATCPPAGKATLQGPTALPPLTTHKIILHLIKVCTCTENRLANRLVSPYYAAQCPTVSGTEGHTEARSELQHQVLWRTASTRTDWLLIWHPFLSPSRSLSLDDPATTNNRQFWNVKNTKSIKLKSTWHHGKILMYSSKIYKRVPYCPFILHLKQYGVTVHLLQSRCLYKCLLTNGH